MRPTRNLPSRRFLVALASLALLGPSVASAQGDEQKAVLAVVTRLFDGMRARDTSMMRSTFAPDAKLQGAGVREGKPGVAITPADDFIRIVGKATGPAWDERIHDPEIRIDGTLASVWVPYEFYLGDKFSHCGVDAFHLARFEDGRKFFDRHRRHGGLTVCGRIRCAAPGP